MERSIELLSRPQPPHDFRFEYGEDKSQFGELRIPDGAGPFPVVVGIHGGWWRAAHGLETHSHLCAALTASGFATWNIEYRRVGEARGGWPGTFLDTGLAVDYLRMIAPRFNLDLSRVITIGFSAGGPLALWAAARNKLMKEHALFIDAPLKLKGAISLAGAVDLIRCAELNLSEGIVEQFLGGSFAQVPERYMSGSPVELLPLGAPHTLIHGTADTSVPVEISERYFKRAQQRSEPCQLIALPDRHHFELIDPTSKCWKYVLESVCFHLEA